ncbi:MAG: hypothetical protein JO001_00040 [Alphaproteobacteria bacterium]|nr:hypothetical protein [Alphaproteobacteria bacterium]
MVRRYRQPFRPIVMLPAPPPPLMVYNNWLPSPYNPGYDRAVVQHFQAPPVSGVYGETAGLPTLPPVASYQPYRMMAGGGVVQLDGLTGQYIRLSPGDAARVLAGGPLPVYQEANATP